MGVIPAAVLTEAVKRANELGRNGVRVKSVAWIPPPTAAAPPNGTLVWECDGGPKTATESWQ